MSISTIVTLGFGSFGSISDIVTLGFDIGEFVARAGTPTLPDPYPWDEADLATIEYWREQQRKQDAAVSKIMREALDGATEAPEDEEELAEPIAARIAEFIPATSSAGELRRFAELMEDEEDIEMLLMAMT